jgi:LysM repeat protein
MSTPNPLIPQGSLQYKSARGTSNVRIAVATIVSIHVVFFGGLLLQGCKRETKTVASNSAETNLPTYTLPPLTNSLSDYYSSTSTLPGEQPGGVAASPTNLDFPGVVPSQDPLTPGPGMAPRDTTGTGEMKEYTILRGDSFYKIAKDNHTTIAALTRANPDVDPARIRPGQKIIVPVGDAAPSSPSARTGSGSRSNGLESAAGGMTYVVKGGDTLTKVARQHGTTVSAIRAANGMRTSRLLVGQKIKIPARSDTNAAARPSASPQ